MTATIDDVARLDIRVGTIVAADAAGEVGLIGPSAPVPDGGRLF